MKSSDQIKEIRSRLNLSQSELAEKLGVSFATVNRWEKGHCEPSQIAVNAIKNLCADNNINFSQLEGTSIITSDEIVTLYHGSKSGLHGPIAPNSRDRCDFGRGFYMGTERMQPLTLICNYPEGRLYTLQADLSGLKILDVEVGLDWALLIAFNRGKLESVREIPLERLASLSVFRLSRSSAEICCSSKILIWPHAYSVSATYCFPSFRTDRLLTRARSVISPLKKRSNTTNMRSLAMYPMTISQPAAMEAYC